MGFSVNNLIRVRETNLFPRVFNVKPLNQFGNNVKLRMNLEKAGEKLFPKTANSFAIKELERLGIGTYGINMFKLKEALKIYLPNINIRYEDKIVKEKDLLIDKYITAILGRIGEEKVFQPFNIYSVLRRNDLKLEEKGTVVYAYLKDVEFYEISYLVDLSIAFAKKACISKEEQEKFLNYIAVLLLQDKDDREEFLKCSNALL